MFTYKHGTRIYAPGAPTYVPRGTVVAVRGNIIIVQLDRMRGLHGGTKNNTNGSIDIPLRPGESWSYEPFGQDGLANPRKKESPVNEVLLLEIEKWLAPKGKLNEARYAYLFDRWADSLASWTEQPGGWHDSTQKHQIFDYWPTERPKTNPRYGFWSKINDLPWVMAEYEKSNDDPGRNNYEVWNGMRADMEDYVEGI
jgi:hypothetical protein